MKTLIVDHNQVSKLLPMAECVTVMEETFKTLARGDAIQPLRQAVWLPEKRAALGLMPSYLGSPRSIGAKVVTFFPENRKTRFESHQGAVLLFDCENGQLLAMVDASSVTAIRTGAVSAAATKALARSDTPNLAILGSGAQASIHLEAMSAIRRLETVRVWSRSLDHAKRFAERETLLRGIPVEAVNRVEEAVADCQIICTTTASTSPILLGKWLKQGVHVNAIGASTPPFRELASDAVAKGRLFVDRRESIINEAEDFRIPRKEGLIGDDHIIGELGEVLLGKVAGRTSDNDVTIFKSVGLSTEDLAAAQYIYGKASATGVGSLLEFSSEREDATNDSVKMK
jgi:ornithine cyclodeaminase